MDASVLEDVGLTRKEASLYVVLVELGSASATELMEKSGFHRAVVYDLLERLIEKGLASYVLNGRKKFFEAANPKRLLELEKEKEKKVRKLVGELAEFSNTPSILQVKIYKGWAGLKTMYEDLLLSDVKEWYTLGACGKPKHVPEHYLNQMHQRRIKKGIGNKNLMLATPPGKKRGDVLKKMNLTEVRYLPKNIRTPTVFYICGNKTLLHSNTSETPFVIVIDNKDVTDSFKQYFKELWRLSPK